MSARLVDALLGLAFVFAAVALAAVVRRLLVAREVNADALVPKRTLYVWVAIVTYFFASLDLLARPDCRACKRAVPRCARGPNWRR